MWVCAPMAWSGKTACGSARSWLGRAKRHVVLHAHGLVVQVGMSFGRMVASSGKTVCRSSGRSVVGVVGVADSARLGVGDFARRPGHRLRVAGPLVAKARR